jgi:hypothetical protein
MSRFIDAILNMIRPYQTIAIILFVLILFTVVGYYTYLKYGKPMLEKTEFDDVANATRRDQTATLKMYWVDWCPYCKNASDKDEKVGPWVDFKKAFDGKTIGTHRLICERVDCSDPNIPAVKDETDKLDIKSYPTIKLFAEGGKIYEYDAKISKESLEKFVNSVL